MKSFRIFARNALVLSLLALAELMMLFMGMAPAVAQQQPLSSPMSWAENKSTSTTCAEVDNITVPLIRSVLPVKQYQIIATHPVYQVDTEKCDADFSGCQTVATNLSSQAASPCQDFWKDGINIFQLCTEPNWWRGLSMNVVLNGKIIGSGHRVNLYKKKQDENSFIQYAVVYQDSNIRLKSMPPRGTGDECFGSSVVIGPAPVSERPYADIQEVRLTSSPVTMTLLYVTGERTKIKFFVNRKNLIADVKAGYNNSEAQPFAILRSMWVSDKVSDVARIKSPEGDFPILTGWTRLPGSSWKFYREVRSSHNTSAPDLTIRIVQ